MKQIKAQYGFPIFIKESSTDYLLKAEKIRVSDIWALWHYIIKSEKKRFPGTTDYPFSYLFLNKHSIFMKPHHWLLLNQNLCCITILSLI